MNVRTEMHTFSSATPSTRQFLTGDTAGKPIIIAGELRLPINGSEKLPTVVIVHSSGGLGSAIDRWSAELNTRGIATFILDSFSARAIVDTINDQSQLSTLAMMIDAYRALGVLAGHRAIDAARVAIMGFSRGAVAAVYSSMERFRRLHASTHDRFAAHIGFYTPCNVIYHDETKTSGKPIRLFHGEDDDYVPIGPARDYVARMAAAGVDVSLQSFQGSGHTFDDFTLDAPRCFAEGETSRDCRLLEGPRGMILNAATGQPFTRLDPCMARGATVAYNENADREARTAVHDFLNQLFWPLED